jgi:hypothetical protein
MNLNPNFSNDQNECPPANEIMDCGMDFIFDKLIDPMQEKLSVEDVSLLNVIGMSFKIIAEQATMYEQIEQKSDLSSEQSDFERN